MADVAALEPAVRLSWKQRSVALAALTFVAATLCFYGLGRNGVHELDEAWQAQAALEMYHSGTWWRPTAFGGPFFSKPALPLWLTVAAYHLLGVTDFATRIWAAFFAAAAVLATYCLGEYLAGVAAGFVAGLALVTSYPFLYTHCARTGEFDSLMVFFFVAATLLFLRAVRTRRGWILCAAATAMASHAKNLAGVLPAIVFLLALCGVPADRRPTARQGLACAFAFAALNLVWLLPMALVHGRPFLEQYIVTEVLRRPFTAGSHGVARAALLYLTALLAGFSPWAVLGLGALVEDMRKAVAQRDSGSIVVLAWVGVLALLLCFGLRRASQWYLIPLFPFLAVSAGRLLLGTDERPPWAEAWRLAVSVAAAGAALAWQMRPLAAPFALWSSTRPHLELSAPDRLAWLAVALVVAVGVAVAWSSYDREPGRLRQRLIVWPALIVLSIAALHGVVRPLVVVDYVNVYVRARDALQAVRGDRIGSVVVNTPRGRFDMLTRYYFANLDGLRPTFVREGPRAALARARRIRGAVWCVLTAKHGQLPSRDQLQGRILFTGSEPRPLGGARFDVTLVEIESGAANIVGQAIP